MSGIRGLVADTGMPPLVIVIVKSVRDAGLRVDQVSKNGPLTQFEHLGFEAGPAAFGLSRARFGATPLAADECHSNFYAPQTP